MLKEAIQDINMADVPVKYIAAACHIDEYGMEDVVTGDELDDLLARRSPYEHVQSVNILLDLKAVAVDVTLYVNDVYKYISKNIKK